MVQLIPTKGADRARAVSRRPPVKRTLLRRWRVALWRLSRRVGFGRVGALGLLVFMVMLRGWDPLPVQTFRLKIFDLYQNLQPRVASQHPVVVVDLDEESLSEVGQWPWPRTTVAQLVRRLNDYGVVAIAFDVVFAEPDRMSPALYADWLEGMDPSLLESLQALPSNDEIFAQVLRNSRVVLGQAAYGREIENDEAPSKQVAIARIGGNPDEYLFKFPGQVRNLPDLEAAATGTAVFTLVPERDSLVRRVPLVLRVGEQIVPSLAVELLRVATGQNALAIKTEDPAGVKSIVVAGVEIPTDRHGRIWVNYAPFEYSQLISAKDVLSATVPPEKLQGKLVLIGTSAAGLFDIKSTPLHPQIPGVAIHAQILETILSANYLTRPYLSLGAEVVLLAVVGLFMIALVPILGAVLALVTGSVISVALIASSWLLYTKQGLLIDVSYTLLGALAIYSLLVFVNYIREETRRRQVRGAFSQYISPALVDQLASDPDKLVLGGETRTMTFLFADVRGFTTVSEQYKDDPQGLTSLMNRFLTPLTRAVLSRKGTIDKYMGDAMMAFWNAPLADPDHPANACDAALSMLEELRELNNKMGEEAAAQGRPFLPLKVGIGVNTGPCVVGNMGSDQRFDYSVLGDSVNLASRLEGQSKTYGMTIIVGHTAAEAVDGRFALLELDLILVKGKHEPERVFALLGDREMAERPEYQELFRINAEMLAHYRAQRWDEAGECLEKIRALRLASDLRPILALHQKRMEAFKLVPPGPDWDGVYHAESK